MGDRQNKDALLYMMSLVLHEMQPDEPVTDATRATHVLDTHKVAILVPSGFIVLLAHWFGTDEFMRVLYICTTIILTPYSLHTALVTSQRPYPGPTQLYLILISIRVRQQAFLTSGTGPVGISQARWDCGTGRACLADGSPHSRTLRRTCQ